MAAVGEAAIELQFYAATVARQIGDGLTEPLIHAARQAFHRAPAAPRPGDRLALHGDRSAA